MVILLLKRIGAYLVDMFIISFFVYLVCLLPFFNNFNIEKYSKLSTEYIEIFSTGGSSDVNEKELVDASYDLTKAGVEISIVTLAISFLYFGVGQFLLNGQTLGKKLLKIKVVPINGNKLKPGLFILREVILHSFLFNLVDIMILLLGSKNFYLNINSILSNINLVISFLVFGFMIFREDQRGLHDIIGGTKVINIKNKDFVVEKEK